MPKIDEIITNYAVYEDAVEYLGMSEVTLPEVSMLTEEIKGAGIAGNVEAIILGHIEAMSTTFNFRTVTESAIKLCAPTVHKIDLRVAQQMQNTTTGTIETKAVKHILKLRPKKFAPGKVAPASAADSSGEYATSYFATYIDGKKMLEIDPLNFIYYVDGTDYLADTRKALGK
jgi:P2 family phage contractile tail tube protein